MRPRFLQEEINMDLSRLYYKGFVLGVVKDNAEITFSEWKLNSELCVKKRFEFSNIQMEEVPAYYFDSVFQKLERAFLYNESPYRGETGFSINPININNLQPNDFPIDEIPANSKERCPTEKDKYYIVPNSKALYKCPNCGGSGYSTCPECKGSGRSICPTCRNSGRAGYIKKEENGNSYYVVCPGCAKSRYGNGFIACTRCNEKGTVACSRCASTGKVVRSIHREDFYIPVETSVVHWHESIPNEMKNFIKSNEFFFADDELNEVLDSSPKLKKFLDTDDTFKYAESEVLLDTEEKIEHILNSFSEPHFYTVKKQFEDEIQNICSKNSNEGEEKSVFSRIIKAHIKVHKINIVRITYDCNSKNYTLWIYGNNNIYTQNSPFLDLVNTYETEADDLISRKKYIKAIRPLETACKISSTSKNFESFRKCRNKLVNAREKSNIDFDIGTFIGLILTAIFYLFVIKNYPIKYPSSGDFFISVLNVHSEKLLIVLTKIANVILNYGLPYDICCAVLEHCIRDKIKNRIIRVFLPLLLILLYTVAMVFLATNFIWFREWGFVATGISLLIVSTILQLTIKIPYKEIPKNRKVKNTALKHAQGRSA